jgi:hypothetical protein
MSTTFPVQCPCGDRYGFGVAVDAGFSATTVEVKPTQCERCQGAGVVSLTVRKTAAYALATVYDNSVEGLRHKDGLVVFGGGR